MEITYDKLMVLLYKEKEKIIAKSRELSWKHFDKKLKVYYPSNSFPSISITGSECAHSCLYCNKHYLTHMYPATTPKKLLDYALKVEKNGGSGILISGGYTEQSILPITPFLDTIMKIKSETNLVINLHPGLVNKNQAKEIYETGVDAISFDLVVDDQVIEEIISDKLTSKNYLQSYDNLLEVGLNVIPHICLGLYFGRPKGNLEALEHALKRSPKLLVFLGLIPTKNTRMENVEIIHPYLLQIYSMLARLNNPEIEQSLGCMRVRDYEYEKIAIDVGINRIAVAKKKSLTYAKETYGLTIKKEHSCCAI